MTRIALLFVLAPVFCLAQGVPAGEGDAAPTAIGHVTYLASPEVKGRKPMSRGSKKARKYIAGHFAELGLVSWGTAEEFEQSVRIGTNVVGVLPGSDPVLKDEIVLVSAHYDHLGKGHLGAADNAAGVAAMLEIATRLANAPVPPKRSVAFAAFDCEERGLWGSVSFSVREDFDPAKIAVNINMDMLGRKGFGVMENTLFLAASHALPEIDSAMDAAEDIAVLSVPSTLAAMRSDHAVFEALDIPTLFFTSGLYGDYHQKEDTLENLDMALLARSGDAVAGAVAIAANAPTLDSHPLPLAGTDAMLESVAEVLDAMLDHPEVFALEDDTLMACRDLDAAITTHLHAPACDKASHDELVTRNILTLGTILMDYQDAILAGEQSKRDPDDVAKEEAKGIYEVTGSRQVAMAFLMALHDDVLVGAYRQVAAKVAARSRLGLVFRGVPTHKDSSVRIGDEAIAVTLGDDGFYSLNAIVTGFNVSVRPRRFARFRSRGKASMGVSAMNAKGTKGDLVDYLLLRWQNGQFGDKADGVFSSLLGAVTNETVAPDFDAWQAWRLAQLGVDSEGAWQRHMGKTNCRELQAQLLHDPYAYFADVPAAMYRIASDADAPAGLRNRALGWLFQLDLEEGTLSATPDVLTTLMPFLDDTSPIKYRYEVLQERFAWDAFPIVGPVVREYFRLPPSILAKRAEKAPTVAKAVHERLQELTGVTGVEPSREAWEAWRNEALAGDPEGNFLPKRHKLNGAVEFRLRKGEPVLTVGGKKKTLPDRATRPL